MLARATFAALVATAAAAYFTEDFGEGWEDRWTQASKDDLGKFVASAGTYYNDETADVGIKTSEDAKFYGLAAKFDTFSNEGKKLIVQFRVKHEQNIDCGGGYVKIFPSTQEVAGISDGDEKAPYNIMFGPDICGPGTRKVHVIFNYKGDNKLTKATITAKSDEDSHLYTLTVSPDNTYQVDIDGEKEHSGSLYEDFDFLKAKEINDPEVSKPDDWVDETMIDDPEDTKPEDWVEEKQIVDPEAEQPEDWDEEMDGEWEAPTIDNPEYKGEFSAKRIDNPEYKGEWVHPQVANPEYEHDDAVYDYSDFGVIGFDLWQVKAGTIFDDVLITSDEEEAAAGVTAFKALKEGEDAMKKAAEDKKKAEEEAAKAAEEAAKGDEEEEEEEEDETGDAEPAKDEL
jgi:calreticulin